MVSTGSVTAWWITHPSTSPFVCALYLAQGISTTLLTSSRTALLHYMCHEGYKLYLISSHFCSGFGLFRFSRTSCTACRRALCFSRGALWLRAQCASAQHPEQSLGHRGTALLAVGSSWVSLKVLDFCTLLPSGWIPCTAGTTRAELLLGCHNLCLCITEHGSALGRISISSPQHYMYPH